jgi:cytidylate kinase
MKPNIAIDGPAGAGKSTVCRKIAQTLNLTYIDTGAMYRALALKILNLNIDLNNEKEITKIAQTTEIELEDSRVFSDGIDVSDDIRKPEVNRIVSKVAAISGVRETMLLLQRKMAMKGGVIMDGRDIATNVLPDADYKFYLSAEPVERARRRYKELLEKGHMVEFEQVIDEIIERDRQDSERRHSPLRMDDSAIFIDTTGRTIDCVIKQILEKIRDKGL